MSKKYTEKAQDYFKRHPSSNECHITSDGRVFHTLGSAQGFAGTLEDQTIESYKKSVLEKEAKQSEGNAVNEDSDLRKKITFDQALIHMNSGGLVKLPEWEGFWFKNIKQDQILVFTKEGQILDNPDESFKKRDDWQLVDEIPEEQMIVLNNYFENTDETGINPSTDKNSEKETKLGELASLELVSSNYQEIKALVKYFDLKPVDQKAETLIAALTEFKNNLNS